MGRSMVSIMNSSIDTNIVLRFILNDVPEQRKKAIKLFDDTSQTFSLSELSIAEIIFTLQGLNFSRNQIVNNLNYFLSMKNIRVSNRILLERALSFYESHPALSFIDCYLAFLAEENGTEPLWTFDRKLSNQHPSAKPL